MMDKKKVEKTIVELLKALGENPNGRNLRKTPGRFADLMAFMLSGKNKDIKGIFKAVHKARESDIVILKNIRLYSLCEHNLLPFFGKCHIAYAPKNNRVIGLNRLPELVKVISSRLQLQERLTDEIADSIMKFLKPKGAAVVVEARHLCMEMCDSKQSENLVITAASRGIFKNSKMQKEFLKLIR